MKRYLFCAVAALLVVGCSKDPLPSASVRELRGSVFLQGEDGQAVRLALARVYPLRADDVAAMAKAAHELREQLVPGIEAARAAMNRRAELAAASEAEPAAALAAKREQLERVKVSSGGRVSLVESFENDVAVLNRAYLKVKMANLQELEPLVREVARIQIEAERAIHAAKTSPPRPVAVAALSDADGKFTMQVFPDCDTILVEAQVNESAARMVWLVPVAGIDFGAPFLFSEHNRHR